ncbi:hypothetical protein L873DRAFT_647127 [Choiromyces venosus 120613-1]|uniref:Uncharacterized protein n=1 Tax=Choiromyces venosus 120613-1 TaxID=1336337 RepID=A0A3N4JTK4_9PEZI|nr:hypothetical protein L873DRAFT_647127 [Choiromyces venosus 120613-1]
MAATVKEIGSLRKKTRRIAAREDTHEMTAAVKGMGDAVALVAEKIGSRAENLGKVHEMEHRLEKMEEYLRKDGEIRKEQADHVQEQQVKTNQLLEGILLRLGEK